MKIGILTFHRAINYGGVLQCYALVTYLRMLGYDAEVVDYRSKAIEDNYRLVKTGNLHDFLYSIKNFRFRIRSKKLFNIFWSSYYTLSKKSYYTPKEISDDYDILVVGSDQVWSKRINKGFDPVFWGQIPGKQKIISYAASMGSDHDFTNDENELIKRYLLKFQAISTREDSLNKEISSLTDKKVVTVVDPTLLLDVNDYRNIAVTPKEKEYVLYYQMEYHPESKKRVIEVALQLKCEVIVIGGKKESYDNIKMTYYNASTVDPTLFIGYILNAKCVFSSSFHGTALSIAMQKDFYFFSNYETDRAENLLKHVGARERMIQSDETISFSPVDYSKVNPLLNAFRVFSMNFIEENLK